MCSFALLPGDQSLLWVMFHLIFNGSGYGAVTQMGCRPNCPAHLLRNDVETRTNVLTHFSFFFLHFQDLKRTSLPTASRFALPQVSSLLSASWTIPAAPTPACPSLALSPPFGHQSKLEKGKRFSTAMVSHPSSLLPTLVQQKRTGWIRMSKQLGRCLHPSSVCFLEEAVHT